MATRVRTAGRFANLVGSDSDSDLGVMESYPRKRQSSIASTMASNRIIKPVSKLAGSIDRKAPRRPALTDKSNLNATRPLQKSRDEKPARPIRDEVINDDSMLNLRRSKESGKKQRLEDSRPVKQSFATTKRHASSSPRHQVCRYPAESVAELEEDDDDMDMVDVVEQKEEDEKEKEDLMVSISHQATAPIVSHARQGSRSQSTQGENDVLERRLREMTRKYENLEGRYTELREVGVKSAERNYEKLRKQADENAATANELITTLKEEVAAQRQALSDADSLRLQLQDSQSNAQDLSDRVKELTSSLAEADRQVKALNAKLAASRAAPGSAVSGSDIKGSAARAWTGQSELVHAAHAKEDLYADLTGLIIQGVKQHGSDDIFDCIQTGRNGTLHFKLGIAGSSSTLRYEDSLVKYNPQLQSDRDADLISRLPNYLREEIEFQRPQVANFYSKVVKALRERQSEGAKTART
ncbi:chromosome segregation protein [Beauveria brongniartii RCEF 3172]|uniref:Chromosome segregation protein n=1 Tax=Beauveria brongniartii RCEF 3172 TaxID=1081107 RepID=A0A167BD15_9HYPO|nr:chromosome segregation protein [Beauveria brongniartii RCEF 3172]